jgi:hypothetical protein
MEGNNLLLFGSVVLNILLFRWAVSEYSRRRKYQKQTGALADALEAVHSKRGATVPAEGSALGWLFAGLILLTALMVTYFYY